MLFLLGSCSDSRLRWNFNFNVRVHMSGCVFRLPRYERGLNLYVELSNWAFRDSSNKTWNLSNVVHPAMHNFTWKQKTRKVWICHNLTPPRSLFEILTSSCWNTETPETLQTPKTLRWNSLHFLCLALVSLFLRWTKTSVPACCLVTRRV